MTARSGLCLGDEAVALAALDAGVTAAYSYPGTPATEILETVRAAGAPVVAQWACNEKSAYEQALGTSLVGRRALVAMKHVGLNVAADPFVNSALAGIDGGLVVAVADDPGMHSSQNEQDTRVLADFARVLLLEPADVPEAYAMTREAFELSERFAIPVVVRLVTRLSHGRAHLDRAPPRSQNPPGAVRDRAAWTLLPANARTQWRRLLDTQERLGAFAAASEWNHTTAGSGRLGVITCGTVRNHFAEVAGGLPHVHVATYPVPVERIRRLAATVDRLLVLEEGYPLVERRVRGLLPGRWTVAGRDDGTLPPDGELDPDLIGAALGHAARRPIRSARIALPPRPPRLCPGCPHVDSFHAITAALEERRAAVVTSDIGCYTLGALPPHEAIDTCICMGASIGMAKGAVDAGSHPVLAVIGDGTFLHSGIPPLLDAIAADTDMTVVILDNRTIAMTGGQPTVVPGAALAPLIIGLGADPDHVVVADTGPRHVERLTALLRAETAHHGLSVVIAVRECVETVRERVRRR